MKHLFQLLLFAICSTICLGQTTYVFVGTFNKDKEKEGIAVYKVNNKHGILTKLSSTRGILNPSYLAIGADSNYVYACTDSQTKNSGYITSFKFDPINGTLTALNRQKTSGDNPVYISIDKTNSILVSVNYTESSVDVYPLSPNGQIEKSVQYIKYLQGSNASERQTNSHAHSVIFSPDFNHILIPDLGADEIKTYSFNALNNQPINIDSYVKNGAVLASGPRHITFHPNGKNVYCIEEIGGTLSNYVWNDGRLRLMEQVSLHEGNKGEYSSADVHVSPDGKFLYASNRGKENNIVIFSIDTKGLLKRVGYQSSLGDHPRMFGISPDGHFLIVANQFSNNLVVFKRNVKTGKLIPTKQHIPIESPSCVQIKIY